MCRNRPLPSLSLYAFSLGLAFLAWTAVIMDRPPKPGTQNRVFNPLFIVPGFMPGMCYGCQRTLLELMRQRTKKNPVKPCGLTGLMYFLVLPWILMWCRDQDLNQGHTDFQSLWPVLTTIWNKENIFVKILILFQICSIILEDLQTQHPSTLPQSDLISFSNASGRASHVFLSFSSFQLSYWIASNLWQNAIISHNMVPYLLRDS